MQGVKQKRRAAEVRPGILNWQEAYGVRLQRSTSAAFCAGWVVWEDLHDGKLFCHLLLACVFMFSCVWLFVTPWTAARQASPPQ